MRGEVQEAVLMGGRGSTKSSFASVQVLLQLLAHPQCHAVVIRKVGSTPKQYPRSWGKIKKAPIK